MEQRASDERTREACEAEIGNMRKSFQNGKVPQMAKDSNATEGVSGSVHADNQLLEYSQS